jgi:hypothetical protein
MLNEKTRLIRIRAAAVRHRNAKRAAARAAKLAGVARLLAELGAPADVGFGGYEIVLPDTTLADDLAAFRRRNGTPYGPRLPLATDDA